MADLHDDNFDAKHFQRGEYNVRRINSLYRKLIDEVVKLITLGRIDPTRLFSFSDYPDLNKSANKLFEQFTKNVIAELYTQIDSSWSTAEDKQSKLVSKIAQKLNLSKEQVKEYLNPNKDAFNAFKKLNENGIGLSDRVWQLSDQFRNEIELGLDIGIGEGKSAAKLARELRSNLNDPDRLFRRVRDKHGNLVLSKAAKAYNPGQGVYRSSAKNAQRLTRTVNNMAYHQANYEKYKQFDFVVGIQIKLSNNPKHCPFCEAMAGNYPKDFVFVGWHPQCRCTTIAILKTWEEMERDNDLIWQGKEPKGSVNEVDEVPSTLTNWIKENKSKIERSKSKPYFIRDNSEILQNKINDKKQIKNNISKIEPEVFNVDEKVKKEIIIPKGLKDLEIKYGIEVPREQLALLKEDYFEVKNSNRMPTAYSHIWKQLNINDAFLKSTEYEKTSVFVHEVGHAIDHQYDFANSKAVSDIMQKYRSKFSENRNSGYKNLNAVCKKYKNITDLDQRTQIHNIADTLKALNPKFGYGHTTEYYTGKLKAEREFIAHCFENKFIGNEILKQIEPELYEDMINLIENLK